MQICLSKLLFLFTIQLFSSFDSIYFFKFSYDSYITLKVKGPGNNQVFTSQSEWFNTGLYPNEVHINGINMSQVTHTYYLNQTENNVKLVWHNEVKSCYSMFCYCYDIIEINFSNFDTSEVTDMPWMFYDCTSLKSLDLSNFDTSKLKSVQEMFKGCKNLEYINMKNFNTKNSLTTTSGMLDNIPINTVFCINPENNPKIANLIKECQTIDCSTDWKKKQKKILDDNKCTDSCADNPDFNFESNGKCVKNCPKGYYEESSIKKCKCDLEKCLSCSPESLSHNLCIKCNEGFYPKYNDPSNKLNYIDCYKNISGYYLDSINSIFKPCYNTCETCDISGNSENHNCIKCKQEFNFAINKNSFLNCYDKNQESNTNEIKCDIDKNKYIPILNQCFKTCGESKKYKYEYNNNCFEKCPNGTKSSKKDEYICKTTCSEDTPYEDLNTGKCISKCNVNEMFNGICKINNENLTKNEKLSTKIVDEILNNNLNELLEDIIKNNNDVIIEEDNAVHQITSLKNQNGKNNLSSIDFGGCEDLLRSKYKINETEELIIYKIEHIIDGFNIPIIEYVLFNQNGNERLNLSICDNVTVLYNIPVTIDENKEYKYDPNSDFYNDKCNKYSSDGNVDMTLYERKNEFNNKNMSLCEASCIYKGYNSSSKQAMCDCSIKSNLDYSNSDNNQDNLINKIDSEKSSSNLDVTECFNLFSNSEQIKSNSGFYVTIILLIVYIIVFIIFCSKGRNNLENQIDKVIYKNFKKNKNKTNNINGKNKRKNTNLKYKNKKSTTIINTKNINYIVINSQKNKKSLHHDRNAINNAMKTSKRRIISTTNNDKKKNKKNKLMFNKNNQNNEKISYNVKNIDNDYELNNLEYKDALKYDKRTCCDYYCSLIKNKQLFAFTFCSFNDYNSGIIKKFIFFLSFALHYTANALFFDDTNMHQIYEDEGKYNFPYQLPKILISAAGSTVILRIILHILVLTDKNVLQVKNQPSYNLAINMKYKVLKCMKIKFAIFFVLNFIIIILFGYYLTCFSAVYKNTQVYLIENTAISFCFSLFYPFVINFFPSTFRSCSIDKKKRNKNCFYNFSKIIQIF